MAKDACFVRSPLVVATALCSRSANVRLNMYSTTEVLVETRSFNTLLTFYISDDTYKVSFYGAFYVFSQRQTHIPISLIQKDTEIPKQS